MIVRVALVACALSACVAELKGKPIDGTSRAYLSTAGDDAVEFAFAPARATRLVLDKLNARGFALVQQRQIDGGVVLEVAGNRDFTAGGHTIGSVFYVTIASCARYAACARVKIVGKPTYDHAESCPSLTGETCRSIEVYSLWGLSGWEEARVVYGVLAELELDEVASS